MMNRSNVATGLTVIALLAIVAASVWLRWPGFTQGGFASHDVAGILYNAMVIERGGLPYVDTLEFKAPGSFYLATWLAGPQGRDIGRFQIAANVWAVLSLVSVAGLGWRVWGRLGAVVAAGVYALHDAHLDTMDANYVTWANLPQIVAVWLGLEALRSPVVRRRPTLWLAAGAFAGFAALCKQPNGIVLVLLIAMAASSAGDAPERGRARLFAVGWVGLGFGLAHLPIVGRYLAAGELSALIEGYFLNRWGLRYVVARDVGLLDAAREGVLASVHVLGLALVLGAFPIGVAVVRRVIGRAEEDERALLWLGAWLVATAIAASVGFRFYKGYFVAMAAPASLIAAAPFGLLGGRCRAHWLPRVGVLLLSLVLVGRQLLVLEHARVDRAAPHDLGGRRIAEHLLAHTEPDDTIWVWGWHLWDVYPLTGRMSASRIYKSLGVLSQPNDDTWRKPAGRLRFVDSPYAAELLADLDANRPAYIVLGSTVPHSEFVALHEFLRAHYRLDRRVRIGRVQFWQRR